MKEYESCFVGIPLPDEKQQDFKVLLTDINQINSLLETSDPSVPHVTIYYLDRQPESNFREISQGLLPKVDLLQGAQLTVGGFDYFNENDHPSVIFLKVQYPEALRDFYQAVAGVLVKYCDVDRNLSFHPHLTVARLRSSQAQQSFGQSVASLKSRLDEASWTFAITEVVLYGIDPTEQPRRQKKLMVVGGS